MQNKPVKWGFKFWVIADPSRYTKDFDAYTGKMAIVKVTMECSDETGGTILFPRIPFFIGNFYNS